MTATKRHLLPALVMCTVLGLWASIALAGSAVLTLKVTGTVAPAPAWQNAAGETIFDVKFNFDNRIAGKANRNVDSAIAQVKLVRAKSHPAGVELMLPTGCAIGMTRVADSHVHLMVNDDAKSGNSHFTIPPDLLQNYQLRFAAAGKYGSAFGAVNCIKNGSLTYEY